MLVKTFTTVFISFISSLILGLILIPYFRRRKIDQRLSIYLEDRHKSKKDTPTMGGLIFEIPVIIIAIIYLIIGEFKLSNGLIILLLTFIGYMLIGLLDDYLIIKRNNNKGLKESHKLILQLFLSIIFFLIFLLDNEPLIWIHFLNIKINVGWLYGLFILLVLVSSSNAVNITDGLDGLATGLAIISFITFGIISFHTGWLDGYKDIALFLFMVAGSLMGFLFFNFYPAKIFMGDTGSLALGALLGATAIITRHEFLLIIIGMVFVLETLSCVIQRIYYKHTKKRIFLMTPIHHTFEKKGFDEVDIVKIFWIVGIISSLFALSIAFWL